MLRRASNAEIPGPDGGVFARHLKAYEAAPAEYLAWCNREYGDVFRFDTGVVVVNDPALIQQVLARTNRDSVPNANPLRGGRFPAAEETERWMRARQEALAVLRPTALPAHLPMVNQVVEADLRALEGEWFDPAEQGWRFCVRALLSVYAPHPSPQLEDALMESFTETSSASLGRVPNWWPSRARRRIEAADQRIRDRISLMLEDDAPAEDPPTLLEILRTAPEPVPHDIAHGAAGMSALGAIGTMGGAWCWLLYHLAAAPQSFDRIRGEVSASGWESIRAAPEQALPYTYSFLHEVLRVHPPAWLLGRDTIADITLGEMRIPAGTAVMFSPYLLHHDPRYWTDPDRFEPERWSTGERPHAPHAYLPFSSGPRGCLAAQLGLSILLLAAARLAAGYDLDVPDLHQIGAEYGPVLLPTGMKCRLTRRTTAAG
ncbi:cytochrome P450 [Actinomadura litoris]|uniref:Cytochrome P450 n=1 Tax=Actinomadura litoris TaxID=2678616 RepID=A0A7K1KT29_9ACTN|nr:cytochrome P450 [Actinomadura litoris]MUN35096.1 cytochrome P450 [Actinomadura litoris]